MVAHRPRRRGVVVLIAIRPYSKLSLPPPPLGCSVVSDMISESFIEAAAGDDATRLGAWTARPSCAALARESGKRADGESETGSCW